VSSTTVSGADPDALGVLAVALERAADELERWRRRLAPIGRVPSAGRLAAIVEWLVREAGDIRRRAVLAASAGAAWRRQQGLVDHLLGVARSAVGGSVQGLLDVSRGAAGVAALELAVMVDPGRGAEATVHAAVTIATDDPAHRALRYVRSIGPDGFWPATGTFVHDTAEQLPTAVLATLAGPELGDVPQALSNLSFVGPFAPAPATHLGASRVEALLRLSVPVGTAGTRRVAVDPADGRFVVLDVRAETAAGRPVRWGELGGDERAALVDAGIVDRSGHLRDRD
jgi:hypothetical protein